jgi:hypothetical protein
MDDIQPDWTEFEKSSCFLQEVMKNLSRQRSVKVTTFDPVFAYDEELYYLKPTIVSHMTGDEFARQMNIHKISTKWSSFAATSDMRATPTLYLQKPRESCRSIKSHLIEWTGTSHSTSPARVNVYHELLSFVGSQLRWQMRASWRQNQTTTTKVETDEAFEPLLESGI